MSTQLEPVEIGPVRVAEPVFLAPMSGVSDLPFRRLACGFVSRPHSRAPSSEI